MTKYLGAARSDKTHREMLAQVRAGERFSWTDAVSTEPERELFGRMTYQYLQTLRPPALRRFVRLCVLLRARGDALRASSGLTQPPKNQSDPVMSDEMYCRSPVMQDDNSRSLAVVAMTGRRNKSSQTTCCSRGLRQIKSSIPPSRWIRADEGSGSACKCIDLFSDPARVRTIQYRFGIMLKRGNCDGVGVTHAGGATISHWYTLSWRTSWAQYSKILRNRHCG